MTGMRTTSVLLRCSVMLFSGVVTNIALADSFEIDFYGVTLPLESGRHTVHFVYSSAALEVNGL